MAVSDFQELADYPLNGKAAIFILPMVCAVAYCGDGSLSDDEFKDLMLIADVLVKTDVPNRELVKKEIILDILDILKDSMDDLENHHERYNFALELTDHLSSKTSELMKNSTEDEQNSFKKNLMKTLAHIANTDGKYEGQERTLIHKIERNLTILHRSKTHSSSSSEVPPLKFMQDLHPLLKILLWIYFWPFLFAWLIYKSTLESKG